jgi:hypothetical protein
VNQFGGRDCVNLLVVREDVDKYVVVPLLVGVLCLVLDDFRLCNKSCSISPENLPREPTRPSSDRIWEAQDFKNMNEMHSAIRCFYRVHTTHHWTYTL